jgi:ribulose 1,5-bisphosphate carboxylase large subunit-like protein
MREAWEAAVGGFSLEAYAQSHPSLQGALAQFGGV